MTEIESCVPYYGFINTEFVQWGLTDGGHLLVCALPGQYVYIASTKWQHKRAFLGPGKIEFKLSYEGSVFVLAINMTPIRERDANELLFRAGRNGVLNLSSRPFSSIFKSGAEQIDPDGVWPFSGPENKTARAIAKVVIYLAYEGRNKGGLVITNLGLPGRKFAWIEVLCALHTYAIVTNALTKTNENDRISIHRALPHEFCAIGFFTAYSAFYELSRLLNEMKKRGSVEVEALASWALSKAAYGSNAYPREKAVESKLEAVGDELLNYLANLATNAAKMEDTWGADWAKADL